MTKERADFFKNCSITPVVALSTFLPSPFGFGRAGTSEGSGQGMISSDAWSQ